MALGDFGKQFVPFILRSLKLLDLGAIVNSSKKTHGLLVVE